MSQHNIGEEASRVILRPVDFPVEAIHQVETPQPEPITVDVIRLMDVLNARLLRLWADYGFTGDKLEDLHAEAQLRIVRSLYDAQVKEEVKQE